ncbi:hypothetical protein KAJ61_04675 [Candidatus Parcubacteria bacterium]|nr:hypothetical protein [Candidatus Parcubacteria bacterium]
MQNQIQNFNQDSDSDQEQNKNQEQPLKKEPFFLMTLKTPVIVLIFIALGAVIIGGGYLIARYDIAPPSSIDLPITNPVIEAQCKIDSTCKLAYTGSNICFPCDTSIEEYKCLPLEEAKKIEEERFKRMVDNNIFCERCLEKPQHICKCENGKCEKVKEGKKDNQNNYFINKNLGIKFDYSSVEFKEKLVVENNQIIYHYLNSDNIEYISLFTKKANQTIEDAILDVIKNEGRDPKNCKVVNKEKYYGNPDYQVYRLDLANPTIIYSEEELERIRLADIEAEQNGGPFNGEHQKQAIRNERLIKACSYYADPLGLGTSKTIPSIFIYNNKNKFVFLPGLANPSFYQEGSIELFDDYYQDEENTDTSDWQTYRNKEFGFEFDYFSEWKINVGKIITNEKGEQRQLTSIDNLEILSGDAKISLSIRENISLENILQAEKSLNCYNVISGNEQKEECSFCSIKESNIVVAGCNGKKMIKINKDIQCEERGSCKSLCIDYKVRTVVFQKDNNVYILNSFGGEQTLEIFNQILSTFKFIEK